MEEKEVAEVKKNKAFKKVLLKVIGFTISFAFICTVVLAVFTALDKIAHSTIDISEPVKAYIKSIDFNMDNSTVNIALIKDDKIVNTSFKVTQEDATKLYEYAGITVEMKLSDLPSKLLEVKYKVESVKQISKESTNGK